MIRLDDEECSLDTRVLCRFDIRGDRDDATTGPKQWEGTNKAVASRCVKDHIHTGNNLFETS